MAKLPVVERWHRFRALPSGDRSLVVEAVVLVAMIQMGLRTVPLGMLRRVLAGLKRLRKQSHPASARIGWAVQAASHVVPRRTCLSDALAADVMLCRRGYPSTLWLGVKPVDRASGLQAHAWVESDGTIVAGALDTLHEYRPFPQRAAF